MSSFIITLGDILYDPTLENLFLLYNGLTDELKTEYKNRIIQVCNSYVPAVEEIAKLIDKIKCDTVTELEPKHFGTPPDKTYILTAAKRKIKVLVPSGVYLCCMYKNVKVVNQVIDFHLETAGSIRKDAVLIDKYEIAHGLKDYDYKEDICM